MTTINVCYFRNGDQTWSRFCCEPIAAEALINHCRRLHRGISEIRVVRFKNWPQRFPAQQLSAKQMEQRKAVASWSKK